MSQFSSLVKAEVISKIFDITDEEVANLAAVNAGEIGSSSVLVLHGYDHQTETYFCDLDDDDPKFRGICYGPFPLSSKRMSKNEYFEAMEQLGLSTAANSVALDIPY